MVTFFGELAHKLADRWLTLLVAPGALWLAAVTIAIKLGNAHWADARRLVRELNGLLVGVHGAAETGAILVGALIAAAAAGIGAQAIGTVIGSLWLAEWPGWLGPCDRYLTGKRRQTWDNLGSRIEEAEAGVRVTRLVTARARLLRAAGDSAAANKAIAGVSLQDADLSYDLAVRRRDALIARRERICTARPARPTWIGDCVAAVQARILAEYGLDLAVTWPRLWLTLPDSIKSEITSIRSALDRACALAGWGLLYLAIGVIWWPCLIIGPITFLTGWHRARSAAGDLAILIESAIDVHAMDLATALSMATADGRLTPETGRLMTVRFRKGG
jgi:hypothetical protein